jgi:adenylate cyclase
VLGYALTFEDAAPVPVSCIMHPLGVVIIQPPREQAESPFFRASGAVCNLPVLARAAGASGFLNAAPDVDGILRRVPLLIQYGGRVYPGLALAAVVTMTGTREIALRVANVNSASLILGDRTVPLDGKSNLLVRYRGKKRTFPYVSAADVMSGRVPADAFKGKLVFVGATALGTREVVATPLDTLFAGVEVQATVADNLLTQHFIQRPESAATLEAQAVLALGIVAVLMLGRIRPAWGAVAMLVWLAVLWGGGAWLVASSGRFLSPLFPTVGLVSAFAAVTLARFTVERRRADHANEQTVNTQRLMVQSLLSLTEVRDADTGRHSRRTQQYARLLAKTLATHPRFRDYLTSEKIDLLASLAPLHDIGKVGVPDRLLNKPGALTPDELAEVRKHPVYGREVILQAERRSGIRDDVILSLAKEIAYTHHEWWDGTGYPQGLRGEEIPIPGRVMALVDVYDALITKRVYCQPKSHPEAIDLIVKGRGTHFDPAVVDAFLSVASEFRELSTHADS